MGSAEGRLIVHMSTQVPHIVRTAIADTLGLAEHLVRVVAPDVGGGFGQKCAVGREELAVAAAAALTRRPVKWMKDRRENLLSAFQGHEQRHHVRAGFDAAGTLLGLATDILCDVGAFHCYPFTGGVEPLMAATEMPGPSKLHHYSARTRAIATNKPPMAPYRGVSRPRSRWQWSGSWTRRRFAWRWTRRRYGGGTSSDAMSSPTEAPPGSSTTRGATSKRSTVWWLKPAMRRCERSSVGFCHSSRWSASHWGRVGRVLRTHRIRHPGVRAAAPWASPRGYDPSMSGIDPSGGATVLAGTVSHGQGHATTLAQMVADRLSLTPTQVRVVQGDTDAVPYGWGTFASRSVVLSGDRPLRPPTAWWSGSPASQPTCWRRPPTTWCSRAGDSGSRSPSRGCR